MYFCEYFFPKNKHYLSHSAILFFTVQNHQKKKFFFSSSIFIIILFSLFLYSSCELHRSVYSPREHVYEFLMPLVHLTPAHAGLLVFRRFWIIWIFVPFFLFLLMGYNDSLVRLLISVFLFVPHFAIFANIQHHIQWCCLLWLVFTVTAPMHSFMKRYEDDKVIAYTVISANKKRRENMWEQNYKSKFANTTKITKIEGKGLKFQLESQCVCVCEHVKTEQNMWILLSKSSLQVI